MRYIVLVSLHQQKKVECNVYGSWYFRVSWYLAGWLYTMKSNALKRVSRLRRWPYFAAVFTGFLFLIALFAVLPAISQNGGIRELRMLSFDRSSATSVHFSATSENGNETSRVDFEVDIFSYTQGVNFSSGVRSGERDVSHPGNFGIYISHWQPVGDDAIIRVRATAYDVQDRMLGSRVENYQYETTSPQIDNISVKVQSSAADQPDKIGLSIRVSDASEVRSIGARVYGVSLIDLARVGGVIQEAAQNGFLTSEQSVIPAKGASETTIIFEALPTPSGVTVSQMPDGLVIADVVVTDVWGNTTNRNWYTRTQEAAPLSFDSIKIVPNPLVLRGSTSSIQLIAVGTLPDGREFSLTGNAFDVRFSINNPQIALVTEGGYVLARSNGAATLSAVYNGYTTSAPIQIMDAGTLDEICFESDSNASLPWSQRCHARNSTMVFSHVGMQKSLYVLGRYSDGVIANLNNAVFETFFLSSSPSSVSIDEKGLAIGKISTLTNNDVTITAQNSQCTLSDGDSSSACSASIKVHVSDASPSVKYVATIPDSYPSVESEEGRAVFLQEWEKANKYSFAERKDDRFRQLRKVAMCGLLEEKCPASTQEMLRNILDDFNGHSIRDCVDVEAFMGLDNWRKVFPEHWTQIWRNIASIYMKKIVEKEYFQKCYEATDKGFSHSLDEHFWKGYYSTFANVLHNVCDFSLAEEMLGAARPYVDTAELKNNKEFVKRIQLGIPDPTGSAREGCEIKKRQGLLPETLDSP